MDVITRRVPRTEWVRVFTSFSQEFEPGHSWLYGDSVRRDAWRIGRVGFGVMWMRGGYRG
jgi:hypothetical protein